MSLPVRSRLRSSGRQHRVDECGTKRNSTRSADVQGARVRRHLVLGPVLVAVRQVGHHLEGHDLDAQLVAVLLDGRLGVVGPVKLLAAAVLARAGVVAADDEVGGAVVLADDGVPDGLARAAHAHGQRQQAQHGHAVGVARQDGLVDAHAGEVVNVAGLGQADDGVDEHVGLAGAGGAHRQLAVGAVHGVAGLEGDDLGPAELLEVGAQLGGGVAQGDVVVVVETVDGVDAAAQVDVVGGVVQVAHRRVLVVAAKDEARLAVLVGPVDVVERQDSQVAVVAEVAQRDAGAGGEAQVVDGLLGHVEADGHGEEVAVGEAQIGDDAAGQRGGTGGKCRRGTAVWCRCSRDVYPL